MDFKTFVQEKINYFVNHFERQAVLLDFKGQNLAEINLSFEKLSDEYLQKMQELQSSQFIGQNSTMKLNDINKGFIKITDKDLSQFWKNISQLYTQKLNLSDQSVTDQTVLKISQLIQNQQCAFSGINLANNTHLTQVSIIKLGKTLHDSNTCKQINLNGLCVGVHGVNRIIEVIAGNYLTKVDLGLIGNESLNYLSKILQNPHKLQHLSFGQDNRDPWNKGKNSFQNIIRRGNYSKCILSINLYPEQPIKHYDFISQLCILCKKNRDFKLDERQNQFKSTSLNPNHTKYYDPDNHNLNAYKFSVKSYLNNVFGSLLDQALYFLEKQRRNSLREQAIFHITKQPVNKIILEDICTADGSIIVLTKYLLAKINEKQQFNQ